MTPEELEGLAWIAQKMHLLQETDGWDEYRKQLAEEEARSTQSLVSEPKEGFEWRQGYILGLRRAAHLPDILIEHHRKAVSASPPKEKRVRRDPPAA